MYSSASAVLTRVNYHTHTGLRELWEVEDHTQVLMLQGKPLTYWAILILNGNSPPLSPSLFPPPLLPLLSSPLDPQAILPLVCHLLSFSLNVEPSQLSLFLPHSSGNDSNTQSGHKGALLGPFPEGFKETGTPRAVSTINGMLREVRLWVCVL